MAGEKPDLKSPFSVRRNLRALFIRPDHHVGSVDGFRAFAILTIFAYHWLWSAQLFIADTYEQYLEYPLYLKWLERGETSVDLFFVVSGFLIGSMLFQEYANHRRLNLKRFFVRRFWRLMPVYWFALGLSVFGLMIEPGPDHVFGTPVKNNIEYVWANLLYVNNFLDPRDQFFGHAWSLAVEEQFYFIFPFMLLGFFKFKLHHHPWKTTWAIVGLYCLVRGGAQVYALNTMVDACGSPWAQSLAELEKNHLTSFVRELNYCLGLYQWDYVYDNMYTKFITLFAGVWASYQHVMNRDKLVRFFNRALLPQVLAVCAAACFVLGFIDLFIIRDPALLRVFRSFLSQTLFSSGAAYIILFCIYGRGRFAECVNKVLSARILYPIAQLAYSVYLFHIVVIMGVYQLLLAQNAGLTLTELIQIAALPTLVLSFAFATFTYVFIERPFMNIRR